jgi:hypothetical protein
MSLQLVAFADQPGRLAATKSGFTIPDGRFFLDFTRPLQVIRWFGVRNRFFGPAVGLGVPIIHEAEHVGGYVICVDASEAHFRELRTLWKSHFPSKASIIDCEANGLKIIADFATQFPHDV